MNWRDFFYFSKGERRALVLLLCLLTTLWIVQYISKINYKDNLSVTSAICDTIKGDSSSLLVKQEKKNTIKRPDTSSASKTKKELKRKFYVPTKKKTMTYSSNKYKVGTVIELNNADTISLKKVPGIGSVFSRRIVKYRNLLGGFYCIDQLKEVYGMDEEKYISLKSWFYVDTTLIQKLNVNETDSYHLYRHPYLNKEQAKAIQHLLKQKSRLSGWENLLLLQEFSTNDVEKLVHYLSFD